MCKEDEILFDISISYYFEYYKTILSGHNTFDANRLFRAYVFALAAAETNLFVDYLQQTITNPQTENRTDFHTSSAPAAVIKNFNSRLHCLQTIRAVYGLGSGSPFDIMNDGQ
jgi:hypothetical protein